VRKYTKENDIFSRWQVYFSEKSHIFPNCLQTTFVFSLDEEIRWDGFVINIPRENMQAAKRHETSIYYRNRLFQFSARGGCSISPSRCGIIASWQKRMWSACMDDNNFIPLQLQEDD